VRREGRSGLALLAFGTMVAPAERIAERFDATLVNMRFIKPLDEELIVRLAARHAAFVSIEENAVAGGAGAGVGNCWRRKAYNTLDASRNSGPLVEHGSREDCLKMAGLDALALETAVGQSGSGQASPGRAASA